MIRTAEPDRTLSLTIDGRQMSVAAGTTIWEAASATKSLQFILWGVVITLPAILAYTVFAYRVFWGKTRELSYD